jgi:hypothetical protein
MRDTTIKLTFTGDVPDGVQVGDKLSVDGVITVHSITAELVDVGSAGITEWLPGRVDIDAYGNRMRFAATREP